MVLLVKIPINSIITESSFYNCVATMQCKSSTLFQHIHWLKSIWNRESLGKWSFIGFCVVSDDLFPSVMNVFVKMGELLTDHHLQ